MPIYHNTPTVSASNENAPISSRGFAEHATINAQFMSQLNYFSQAIINAPPTPSLSAVGSQSSRRRSAIFSARVQSMADSLDSISLTTDKLLILGTYLVKLGLIYGVQAFEIFKQDLKLGRLSIDYNNPEGLLHKGHRGPLTSDPVPEITQLIVRVKCLLRESWERNLMEAQRKAMEQRNLASNNSEEVLYMAREIEAKKPAMEQLLNLAIYLDKLGAKYQEHAFGILKKDFKLNTPLWMATNDWPGYGRKPFSDENTRSAPEIRQMLDQVVMMLEKLIEDGDSMEMQ